MKLTATGAGYYKVFVNGVEKSKHLQEREAIDVAEDHLRADPSAVIYYTHDYTVRVEPDEVAPPPPPEPVDCVMSEWGAWEPTSEWTPCVDGKQTRTERRTRTIITPASNGGAECGATEETRTVEQVCTVEPPPTGDVRPYFAAEVVVQPNTGHKAPPYYCSVHAMPDGRILSIGHIGTHGDPEGNNATYAINRQTREVDVITHWEQVKSSADQTDLIPPGGGYNKHYGCHDNFLTAYFAQTNTAVWAGFGVVDITAKKVIRGNRYPQTKRWDTYIKNYAAYQNRYNAAVAECKELGIVVAVGESGGGLGQFNLMTIFRHDPADPEAPWVAEHHQGIVGMFSGRNEACCIGKTLYLGAGVSGSTISSTGSVLTFKNGHHYQDGDELRLYQDDGSLPGGLSYASRYFVRDVSGNTLKLSQAKGGNPIAIADFAEQSFMHMGNVLRSVNLETFAVETLSARYGNGIAHVKPCLVADTKRNRLILIGDTVEAFDLATRTWAHLDPENWPVGGFNGVNAAYFEDDDSVWLRGLPNVIPPESSGYIEGFKWHQVQFSPAPVNPTIERGIADTVSNDAELAGKVEWYPRMDSNANIRADFGNTIGDYGGGAVAVDPQFVSWPEIGVTALRASSDSLSQPYLPLPDMGPTILGSTWRKYLDQSIVGQQGAIAVGNVPVMEANVRYCLRVDPDVAVGINEAGVKLPGFDDYPSGSNFSTRMWYGRPVIESGMAKFPFATYWYVADPNMGAGGAFGWVKLIKKRERGGLKQVYLVAGKLHCIEQYLKLNTQNADGTWNADGAIIIWFDGERVFENLAARIQGSGTRRGINNFFCNIYHGGMATPLHPIHHEIGAIALTTGGRYIGPPKGLV